MLFDKAQFKSFASIFPKKHKKFQTIKSRNKYCNKQINTKVGKDRGREH